MLTSITVLLLVATSLCVVQGQEHGGHCCSAGGYDAHTCAYWCIYDQTQEGFCDAKYVPGGDTIILDPIEAPVATVKDYSNAHEASNAGFLVSLASDINDFVPTGVKKFSEQFAKGLGIFGAVISGIGSFKTPSPNDIIDACNKAISELTDEVNAQFANMKSYVDQSIMQAQADAMEKFMTYFQTKFMNCFEEPSEASFVDCLTDTERDIHASSVVFMRFKLKFEDTSFAPTNDEIKRMEMEFITFMNYATLRTVNLLIMYDTFNKQVGTAADKQTCRFLTSLKRDLNEFIGYTTNMYDAILKGHNQTLDFNSFKENMQRGWSSYDHNEHLNWIYTGSTYKFWPSTMLTDSDTYYCELSQKIRHEKLCKDQYCEMRYQTAKCHGAEDGYDVTKCRSYDRGYAVYNSYVANMVKSAQNYWKPQTIDRMTPWKEISDQVEEKRSAKGCDAIESSEESGKDEL